LSLHFVPVMHGTEPHATHVQGHKVKYWSHNNSATDCSIWWDVKPYSINQSVPYTTYVQGQCVTGQGHRVKG